MYFEPQTRREPQIRLFRSEFLESLTRVHPIVVVLVWVPVIGWFLCDALTAPATVGAGAATLVPAFAAGLLAWTLVEYALHRLVFHFTPTHPAPWVARLIFLFHGIHHVQPWDKTRLVMPLSVSIPLAVLSSTPCSTGCSATCSPRRTGSPPRSRAS